MLRERVLKAIIGERKTAAQVAQHLGEPAGISKSAASSAKRVLPILNELALEGIALREVDETGAPVARWTA